jgi:ferredoxin--NADP+ reductase
VLATFAERGVEFTTWQGWLKLNAHEIALGEVFEGVERERVKVVARDEQVGISNS